MGITFRKVSYFNKMGCSVGNRLLEILTEGISGFLVLCIKKCNSRDSPLIVGVYHVTKG